MNKIRNQIRKVSWKVRIDVKLSCSIVNIGVALLIFSPYFMSGIAWADEDEVKYRFVVMADSRCGNGAPCPDSGSGVHEAVFSEKILPFVKSHNPAFVVFTGDMVLGKSSTVQTQLESWVNLMNMNDQGFPLTKIMPAWGGHEQDLFANGVWTAWQSVFDPAGTDPSKYFDPEGDGANCHYPDASYDDFGRTVYYCDYENARFFVLNNDIICDNPINKASCEYHTLEDQLRWIEDHLVENGKKLNFFFHHEPAYGTGAHLADNKPLAMDQKPEKRNQYIQLLGGNIAKTMIFSGHEHQYTRRLINETFAKLPINNPGAGAISFLGSFYEVKTGTCGAPIYPGFMPNYTQSKYVFGPKSKYHFAVVDVFNETVSVKVHDVDGEEIDSFFYATDLFDDVPPGYWAEDAIYKIYYAGITTGCSKTPLKYCPERTVTRDQMAVFLGRGIHDSSFTPPPATGIFDDVPVSYWAAAWIEQFYKDGITTGCEKNPLQYCPTDPVTRAQMAIFLLRSKHGKNYTPPKATGIFSDVPVNSFAADWIEDLFNQGITTGCQINPLRYCPASSVTRAQMAVFIVRTFDL